MRKLREVLTLWVPILIGVTVILVRIRVVEEYLIDIGITPLYIGLFLAGVLILNHIVTVFSPYRKYERLEKNKWVLFSYLAQKLQADYHDTLDLRVNVMTPERKCINRLEPKKGNIEEAKLSWFGKVLQIAWDSERVQSGKRLKITANQGVCGMAFRDKKLYAKDLTQPPIPEYNFTKHQYEQTDDLVFVISCPIFKDDKYYLEQSTDNVIGVLNVESSTVGANWIIERSNKNEFSRLCNEIVRISDVCSKIL